MSQEIENTDLQAVLEIVREQQRGIETTIEEAVSIEPSLQSVLDTIRDQHKDLIEIIRNSKNLSATLYAIYPAISFSPQNQLTA